MALAYIPPGVNVEELSSPSINPILATSAQICLVGLARGYEVRTTQVVFAADGTERVLTAPTGYAFIKVTTDQTFESVKNVTDPTAGSLANQGGYEEAADGDFTATVAGDGSTITVTPVADGILDQNGGALTFTYHAVPTNYYVPTRLDSVAAIEQRYGPAFNSTGAIATPLTAAAQVAFENGAANVIIQPLFKLTDGANPASTRIQPSAVEAAAAAQWAATFYGLRDYEDINVLVPVMGQSLPNFTDTAVRDVLFAAQDHMAFMKTQGQQYITVGGEDSSASSAVATATTLRDHAGQLRGRYGGDMAEHTVFVSPSRFRRPTPTSQTTTFLVGGQYVAAAIAGMLASRPTSATLTRKQLAGFLEVADPRDKTAKDADGAAGLMVIEQKGAAVQVRHAITLSDESTAKRELSVVRAKHRMIESLRETVDTQIIGLVPADGNAPFIVKNAVIGVLEALRGRAELVDYRGVQARTLTGDPTTVEVRFSYLPAFPLNFVNIVFSIDLTGATTFETVTV